MNTTASKTPAEPVAADSASPSDLQAVQQLKAACARIKAELGKVIVGQEQVVDQVLIAILTRSHALLVACRVLRKLFWSRRFRRRCISPSSGSSYS
jgi:MoxR-like ATPase